MSQVHFQCTFTKLSQLRPNRATLLFKKLNLMGNVISNGKRALEYLSVLMHECYVWTEIAFSKLKEDFGIKFIPRVPSKQRCN